MKYYIESVIKLLGVVIFTMVINTGILFAETFNFSYSLVEGGYNLELNSASAYKGVRIVVDTDVAAQYEIQQKVITPLENRGKPGTTIRENFVVHRLADTSATGTFYVQTADMPVNSFDRVYTSPSAGPSCNFTLIYGVSGIDTLEAGEYFGRISFTLLPIGASQQSVTRILDVYVNISQQSTDTPTIEITPVNSLRTISLSTKDESTKSSDVTVRINGNFNRMFSIAQIMIKPLESNEGNQLSYQAVNCIVNEATKGMPLNHLAPLSNQQQTLYTSTPTGDKDDAFVINYSLVSSDNVLAGRYVSRIQYMLDEDNAGQKSLGAMDLEVEVGRVFDIFVSPENQMSSMEFNNLSPKEPPRRNEVVIEVSSNIGRQYQVNQSVLSDLRNKEGKNITSKYFTLVTESLDTKGVLKAPQEQEVKSGDSVLFISDVKGSSDKFKIIYELTCPMDVQAGDYSTRITYSLTEI